ncbi:MULTISPECIES: hypothetical protein [unclassified Microcoleus]|uniref:hypothetical protein n=1 Tax=unclassified Microcoleus TaxID=2642155 RepID=UPI002FD1A2A9
MIVTSVDRAMAPKPRKLRLFWGRETALPCPPLLLSGVQPELILDDRMIYQVESP